MPGDSGTGTSASISSLTAPLSKVLTKHSFRLACRKTTNFNQCNKRGGGIQV